MSNFLFISPNFPENYRYFCAALKRNGMNVLGIGDCPYEELHPELRDSLTEYYKVSSLENEEEVYRATAFLIYKHGKIEWIESNNEYWLERDAKLRTAFHVTTGFQEEDMSAVKYKSAMKEYYRKAGVNAARWHIVDDEKGCMEFIREAGWPVIVKPDNGVGASSTYKLKNEKDLEQFLSEKDERRFIMEEFVRGTIHSYDAIVNQDGEPIFESSTVTPESIMDIVNDQRNVMIYVEKEVPEKVLDAGRRTVKAFGVKSRFVHFEFFVLDEDQYLGKKGEVVALEVNMRPAGGFCPDMFNYANSVDVYQIWADMICFGKSEITREGRKHYYSCFCGRRDGRDFAMNHEQIMRKYGGNMKATQRLPHAIAVGMGDTMYLANFETVKGREEFFGDLMRGKG